MIGVLVNPVAGIGGPAGLSGSDGTEIQTVARERGAVSRAHERMVAALRALAERQPELRVLTAGGAMGARAVAEAGIQSESVYTAAEGATSAEDTRRAVQSLAAAGATLVLFAGGDGTARDVLSGLPEEIAVLGVPSGVKMYSGVFAVAPRAAGAVAAAWVEGQVPTLLREVLDIDEAALRERRVSPKLYGTARVPVVAGRTQARKSSSLAGEHQAVQAAARGLVALMEPGVRYALGPGGTMQEVARLLGYEKRPLGVDVVQNSEVLCREASELELLELLTDHPAKVVVSVIGGQGFIIGRGNQQVSGRVLRAVGQDGLLVVAPEQKLLDLRGAPLLVDSGDPVVDQEFSGLVGVITGVRTKSIYRCRRADREET